jgi:hypothetical protein
MSRTNRRRTAAERRAAVEERAALRRRAEREENAPGYGNPPPWSLRGILTLYALMMVINVPVAAVAMRLEDSPSYAYSLVVVNVFLYLLYALLAMPSARRLAREPRLMRPLESIAAGAVMYLAYVLASSAALTLSRHNMDAHDAKQLAGVGVAGLIGGALGAAAYPWIYRKLWMHRLPRSRR